MEKASVMEFIAYVNEITSCYEQGSEDKYELIKADLKVIEERINDNYLYLGVVGSFSSGKSTFINSLIHKNLLPTDAVQGTTVAASVLKKSNCNDLEIVYSDGTKKLYSIDSSELDNKYRNEDICDYRENKDTIFRRLLKHIMHIFGLIDSNHKSKGEPDSAMVQLFKRIISTEDIATDISYVTLYYENENIPHNIAIVDTPGTESLNKRHNTVTKNAIDNICDAIVVIIPYDEPVSEDLLQYINRNLAEHKQECIFIVTKVELLGDLEELPRLIQVIKKRLENGLGISDVVVIAMPTLLYLKVVDKEMSTTFLDNIADNEKKELINMYEEGIYSINKILEERRNDYIRKKIISICDRVESRLKTNLTDVIIDYDEQKENLQKDLVPSLSIFEEKVSSDIEKIIQSRINRLEGELSFIRMNFSILFEELRKEVERCSNSQELQELTNGDTSQYFLNIQSDAEVLLKDVKNELNKQIHRLKDEYIKQYEKCGVSANAKKIQMKIGNVFAQELKNDCDEILQTSLNDISLSVRRDTKGFFNKVKSLVYNPLPRHKEMAISEISSAINEIAERTLADASIKIKENIILMKEKCLDSLKYMIEEDRHIVVDYLDSKNAEINDNLEKRNQTQEFIDGLEKFREILQEEV